MSITLTRLGMLEGCRQMLPVIPPVTLFGVAVGAAAAQKGLSFADLTLMNAAVYAGASQLVALGLWQQSWTWSAAISIALVTLAVNARLILMGASMRPWMGTLPAYQAYPILFFLTDANWIAGQRYHAEGGRDIGTLLGGGLILWCVWLIAPVPGFLLGKLAANPRDFGLDLVMPVFFVAMVARLWKGHGDSVAWAAAGLVGFAAHKAFGGAVHVVIGSLTGMAIAAFLARPSKPAEEGGA